MTFLKRIEGLTETLIHEGTPNHAHARHKEVRIAILSHVTVTRGPLRTTFKRLCSVYEYDGVVWVSLLVSSVLAFRTKIRYTYFFYVAAAHVLRLSCVTLSSLTMELGGRAGKLY